MGQFVEYWNPFTSLFIDDPLFSYSLYPLPTWIRPDEKRRLDRVYYPRTRKALTESFQVIIFRDARIDHFSPRQYHDLEYVFREAGMASVAVHSLSWDIWYGTVLFDISPISGYRFRFNSPWRVRFRTNRDPVFLPFVELGIEKVWGAEYGIMDIKQGTIVWADMVPQNTPWLVSWRPGGGNSGMQWVFADKFDLSWWATAPRGNNLYAPDLATNLLLYSLKRPLISDIHARREAKRMLSIFRTRELMILSMLNWAERFGANTYKASTSLSELEEQFENVVEHYLEQDYAITTSFMEELDLKVSEISELAEGLKDQALFWVYVFEWIMITSVSMIAGFILWSLMVKRRLYRPVPGTRKISRYR
jgi:hypothetical protein